MVQLRNVTFSSGSAVVTNGRHQHLHSRSFVPKDPIAVVVFLPGVDESCMRYAGLFRYLASQQIAVFALEQNPSKDTVDYSDTTTMYKHPNPEVNFEKQASNVTLFPAPSGCGVGQYVDDVHHFASGVAQRIGDRPINYFLCGMYYGGLMAAHSAIISVFSWKGVIMTTPDMMPPVSILSTLTSTITSQWRSFMPVRPTLAAFRDKLVPRSKDHMGHDFTDTTERTFTEDENKSETSNPVDEAFKELDLAKESLQTPVLLLHGKTDARRVDGDAHNFFLGLTCPKKEILEFKELYYSMGQELGNPEVNESILKWIQSFQDEWL
ncbi:hypothetical protein LEN26_007612 [Aphanomyces euteiches]|nr:hypothetical protein AeMF1_009198 [Aphanomyces euteiches]KAH9131690.1 hypothetical protein LEN26_007612 [Aphanomyces euteiches]KAH9197106.1 hypothetical protein AeNC1_000915 [Aphanomyces euteiches]